jgi:hypothetical protein
MAEVVGMRRVRGVLAVGAILAAILLLAAPARAGDWAVTVVDPLP